MHLVQLSTSGKKCLLIILGLITFSLYAQSNGASSIDRIEQDTAQANQWMQTGTFFQDSTQYDSALRYYQQAADVFERYARERVDTSLWQSYVACKTEIGLCYQKMRNFERSLQVFTATFQETQQYVGEANPDLASLSTKIGDVYYKQGLFEQAQANYREALVLQLAAVGEINDEVAYLYTSIGIIHAIQSEYKPALENFQKSISIKEAIHGKNDVSVANIYNNVGIVYREQGEFKKALATQRRVLNIKIAALEDDDPSIAASFHGIGAVLYDQGFYKEALDTLQMAVNTYIARLGESYLDLSYPYVTIGNIYQAQGLYDKALQYQQKSLKIGLANLGREDYRVAASYNNIGLAYLYMGAYEKALTNFQEALSIRLIVGEVHQQTARHYDNIGKVYLLTDDYEEALDYFQKSLDIRLVTLGEYHLFTAESYSQMATTYMRLKDYENALASYDKTLGIALKAWGDKHPEVASIYNNLGKVYRNQGDDQTAMAYYQKALAIRLEVLGTSHPKIADNYIDIGNVLADEELYQESLTHYQQSLLANTPDFTAMDFAQNPAITESVLSKQTLLVSLQKKAKVLRNRFAYDSHDLKDLSLAYQTYLNADQWIDAMRAGYERQSDKGELMKKAFYLYQEAIQTNLELHEQTQQDSFLYQAFTYFEKSRAMLLLEDLNNTQAKSFAGIADSLLEQEQEIIALLGSYEQNLLYETQKKNKADPTKITSMQNKIFALKHKADSINAMFETEFPQYYRLKYDVSVAAVQDIQANLLDEQTALIEYFIADSAVYIYLITDKTLDLIEVPHDFPLHEWVQQFQSSIYTWYLSGEGSEEKYQAYADTFSTTAYRLYQKLLAPIFNKHTLSQNLIIVPDGVLGYIPFELLLTEVPEHPTRFADHAYLIKDYQISYNYSATLLQEMKAKQHQSRPNNQLLAFAPSFEDEPLLASATPKVEAFRSGMGPLRFNIIEAQTISELLGGEALIGYDATEEQFINRAPQYRILHLATHGKANDKAGDYSFLAFANIPDSVENEFLYTRDLYTLQLNADMVVLSACETGIGELQRGEGILSLARGFSYAGAKSIITSLWSINDATTTELMESFYVYIKEGRSKDAALRQAKLDYLTSHPNEELHPFYWGAMVAVGDMTPIDTHGTSWWWILAGVVALGLGLGGYVYTRRKIHFKES